ncbi:flagellar basal body P-ring formation chaperone FlgA [Falsiroseomonas sp. CW058]|uniref:flagellar basal body P-ring formation chaperone FlgA n=1 Tax=Falsiroseomonas sp. CW058 TaxID=3388664 RepID=UPI003D31080F
MRATLLLLGLLLAAPALAQGPRLRAQAVVEGGTVTLGDIFDDAGPRADATLGPAPAPGRRFVVEAPQLAAIARDYGLAWRPLAGDERVVVERPGRAMRREEALEPLRAELVALGADPALDLDIPGFQPPVLPANAPEPRVAVDGASWDAPTRRFAATLVIVAEGMPTFRQRIAGRAVAMRDVLVATRAIRAGEVVRPGDVQLERLPVERIRPGTAEDPRPVVGQRLRRAMAAGQPVAMGDVAAAAAVARDATVTLQYDAPGLSLTAQGRALEDGFPGRTIPVLNLATGGIVLAEVLEGGRLRAIGPAPASALPPNLVARGARRDVQP